MKYNVPLIAQTTNMSCWAASMAMILGWRNRQSVSQRAIASNFGGPSYMPQLTSGLNPNDRYILERNGFTLDAPMCYSPSLIESMLDSYGPLWVASAVPSAHIRVVTGLDNGVLYINDPWPVSRGAKYTRSFSQFFGAMETLGAVEVGQPSPIYVAYLAS